VSRVFVSTGILLCALACAARVDAQVRKLSDAELDKVTAGRAAASQPTPDLTTASQQFEVSGAAGSRHTVAAAGSVKVLEPEKAMPAGSLVISDSAQQNLQSFINIAAVNSRIQVLVNLNVIINSTLGTLQQLNISAPVGGP
jgi:hypothetical protein